MILGFVLTTFVVVVRFDFRTGLLDLERFLLVLVLLRRLLFLLLLRIGTRLAGCAAIALACSRLCTCSFFSIRNDTWPPIEGSAVTMMVMRKRSSSARRCARFWFRR